MSDAKLTEEQKKFLEECELEFADRFSDHDEEYKAAYEREQITPPLVTPWYARPRFQSYRHPHRHDGHRGHFRDRYAPYAPYDRRDRGYQHRRPHD